MTMAMISGNTFPVKDQLKKLGGKWDKNENAWFVPMDKEVEALALVSDEPRKTAASQSYSRPAYSSRYAGAKCPTCGGGSSVCGGAKGQTCDQEGF